MNETGTKSKNKNITELYRGISDSNKDYQPRTNILNDEKCDVVADCHSILARWRNYFCRLLNLNKVSDVRQTEIHAAVSLLPEAITVEVEMAIEKLKRHKSKGTDQIVGELINAGGSTL
jgi:hypothetical protein